MADVTYPIAVGAGLISFLSPCVLPLAPPYLCYLAGTSLDVIASGGVGTTGHLRELADLRVGDRSLSGVIAGRAIYEGTVDLVEGLAACAGGPS